MVHRLLDRGGGSVEHRRGALDIKKSITNRRVRVDV
jgi:hypothetical protein